MKALAYTENNMDNTEQLIKAIDSYDSYSAGHRRILKLLVEFSIDDVACITVMKLSKISSLSREMVYQILYSLQEDGLIEITRKTQGKTARISQINLKPNKLNRILQFYNKEIELEKKYIKEV